MARPDPEGALPGGAPTFVFTDVEGSTALLRRLGGRYAPLLDAHRRLILEAADARGGVHVSTDGDALFLAFERADDALAAALAAQRRAAIRRPSPSSVVPPRHCGRAAGKGTARGSGAATSGCSPPSAARAAMRWGRPGGGAGRRAPRRRSPLRCAAGGLSHRSGRAGPGVGAYGAGARRSGRHGDGT